MLKERDPKGVEEDGPDLKLLDTKTSPDGSLELLVVITA